MNTQFYKNVEIIDKVIKKEKISSNEINLILNYVSEEKYSRYFFNKLDNPSWIEPLYEKGMFYKIPSIIEIKPGTIICPDWPAGKYLARFADQFEDIIIDLIQNTITENYRVQEIFIDCLLKISPINIAKIIPKTDSWLDGRFSQMLPIKLQQLSEYLIVNGFPNEAIQILEYVIKPVLKLDKGELSQYFPPLQFRSDHYWVNDYLENQIPKLLKVKALETIEAFQIQLMNTIDLVKQKFPEDVENRIGYWWRIEISKNIFNRNDYDVLDILIDGLRDGMLELCSQSILSCQKIIESQYYSNHIIFRRIALYILRVHGEKNKNLLEKAFLNEDFLHIEEFRKDYCGLLRDQFKSISTECREKVISFILEGPRDIDQRAKRYAQFENREVSEKDRQIVQEKWKLYHLEILKDFLSGILFHI